MWTGRKGQIAVADILIRRGADIEARDATGRTAIHHAAAYARAEFVEFLTGQGANVNALDSYGWSALDLARRAERRNEQLVKLLESLGADGPNSSPD